jgi:hypothetical protein
MISARSRHGRKTKRGLWERRAHKTPRLIKLMKKTAPVYYLPRLRLWRIFARSFLYLCFRIFFLRFLITLPNGITSFLK